jgi:hypothetical protein
MQVIIPVILAVMIVWGLIETAQTIRRWQTPIAGSPQDSIIADQANIVALDELADGSGEAIAPVVSHTLQAGQSAAETGLGHLIEGAAHLLHH